MTAESYYYYYCYLCQSCCVIPGNQPHVRTYIHSTRIYFLSRFVNLAAKTSHHITRTYVHSTYVCIHTQPQYFVKRLQEKFFSLFLPTAAASLLAQTIFRPIVMRGICQPTLPYACVGAGILTSIVVISIRQNTAILAFD